MKFIKYYHKNELGKSGAFIINDLKNKLKDFEKVKN